VCVFSLFNSSTGTLIDSITVLYVKESGAEGEEESYGEQRLWAAIGWGTMSFVSGWLVDHVGMDAIFYTFSVAVVFTIAIVLCYFKNPAMSQSNDEENHDLAKGGKDALTAVLCTPKVLLLFSNLLVTGILIAFVESFLFVYMTEVYAAPQSLMGLCVLVMTTFELPVFYYSRYLLDNIGIGGLITIAHFLYVTRVLCYTLIPSSSPWMFLFLEPTHGMVFAGMWIASVELASQVCVGYPVRRVTYNYLTTKSVENICV